VRIPVFLKLRITGPLAALLLMLAGAGYLFPDGGIYSAWVGQYPTSATGAIGCQVCHGTSTGTVNGYGRAIQLQRNSGASTLTAILNVASANSDSDPGAASNLAEITAGAQPGWTSGNNTLYNVSGGGPYCSSPRRASFWIPSLRRLPPRPRST